MFCVSPEEYEKRVVNSVAFSPDGKLIAAGARTKVIICNVQSGKEIQTLTGHEKGGYVDSVAFSPNGKLIASGSRDKTIKIWDVDSGNVTQTLKGHEDRVTSVAFNPDGKYLASGSWDKTIKIWNTESWTKIQTLTGHKYRVRSIAFKPLEMEPSKFQKKLLEKRKDPKLDPIKIITQD